MDVTRRDDFAELSTVVACVVGIGACSGAVTEDGVDLDFLVANFSEVSVWVFHAFAAVEADVGGVGGAEDGEFGAVLAGVEGVAGTGAGDVWVEADCAVLALGVVAKRDWEGSDWKPCVCVKRKWSNCCELNCEFRRGSNVHSFYGCTSN